MDDEGNILPLSECNWDTFHLPVIVYKQIIYCYIYKRKEKEGVFWTFE